MTGIYIHVPFCSKRCPYCAFVLLESDGSLHARFVDAIVRQLGETKREPMSTLYFGGGTPSMLEPEQIARIIGAADRFPRGNIEITLEANPEGIGLGRLKGFRDAGVNRITLGVQSTDEAALKFLGRGHSKREAVEAFHAVRAAGIRNICVDLIFGWPGQTVEDWKRELESWSAAEHVSIYGLTVEKGTALERQVTGGLALPGDDSQKVLYEMAMEVLPQLGFRQYELSNFAKQGFESRHNSGYWTGKPYLGFGPGAHSYVAPRRWAEISNIPLFIERVERGESVMAMEETLTGDQMRLERIFLGLRRSEGLFIPGFDEEFCISFRDRYAAPISESIDLGLAAWHGGFFALTPKGRLLADAIIGKFA